MPERWNIEFYRDARGRAPVERFIDELPARLQGRVLWTVELLAEHGTHLGMPHARPVTGYRFWELRTQAGRDIVRILYFAATGRRFVLLHGFVKKTRAAPERELRVANERQDDYLHGTGGAS